MKFAARTVLAFALACLLIPRSYADESDSSPLPSALAPFIEEETIAVVRLDAERINIPAFAAQLEAAVPIDENSRVPFNAGKVMLAGFVDQFRKAGGREAYLVVTPAGDLTKMAFFVVPVAKEPDLNGLMNLLPPGSANGGNPLSGMSAAEWNGTIFYGHTETLDRLKSPESKKRALPREAFTAVAKYPIQAFILPNADQRRVIDEFLPGAASSPGKPVRDAWDGGIQWIALGIGATEMGAEAKLEIASKDENSARALRLWTDDLGRAIATHEGQNAIPPEIERVIRILTPQVTGNRLSLTLGPEETKQLAVLVAQPVRGMREEALTSQSKNSLKQLALAMHNYHDVYKQFPPAAIRDKEGNPLLSWRVAVLPYLDAKNLYDRFHLDEPWDSEHNKKLISQMPDVLASRSDKLKKEGKTTFLVPIGEKTIFGPKEGVHIQDIIDGTANTLLILEADESQAVIWTKPDDLKVDGADLKKTLFGNRAAGFGCVFCDGAWHHIKPDVGEDFLRAILTRYGKESVNWPN